MCIFASLGACAFAVGVALAAKFGADLYIHDSGYALDRLGPGFKDYAIGLAIGGAGGSAMKAGWRMFAESTGKGIALPTAQRLR